ncbi:BTB domain-containing protein [Aphelenchoides bicaudatus]|nr:BTB domain-containing protein [Aphelenchoides bicaudatus]
MSSSLEERGNHSAMSTENGEYQGMDCYADDRDALNDFAKYYNNDHLSDVCIIIEEERFAAHRLILCRSSEVFDRMLSKRWNKQNSNEFKLNEEPECQRVFAAFLRFLYCNHVVLNEHNVLHLLVLADKYSVHGLRKVCVDYASKHVLPFTSLKTLIHVWFKYSTTAYHRDLTRKCVRRTAEHMYQIISDEDWEMDWVCLDRDQLIELLKSSDLVVPNEFVLWEAVQRWFNSSQHPQRQGTSATNIVKQILPLIRFPYMTADELTEVENSSIAKEHPDIISPITHIAFKYISMPLTSRAKSSEFNGIQFLVRNFTDNRWDKRLTIPAEQLQLKPAEHRFSISTRSSTFPLSMWDWELIFTRNGGTSAYSMNSTRPQDELSIELKSVDLDQQRSIEFMLSICNDTQLLLTFNGRKCFTKSRTTELIELDNRLTLKNLFETDRNLSLLHNGELNMQLVLRPIV